MLDFLWFDVLAHPSIIAKREVFNNNRYIQTV